MTQVDSDEGATGAVGRHSGPSPVAAPPLRYPAAQQPPGEAVSVVREAALLPVLVALIIVGALVSPVFFTVSNFSGIACRPRPSG